jgi:hypothetical protein
MKHYGVAQWVDFARGLVPELDGSAMRSHLTEGCSECREVAEFCSRISAVANAMSINSVPDWVVRDARSIFPAKAPEKPRRAFRIPVELVYDSFLVPAPVGLRATWQIGWQALYRAGDCSLDLRIEPELYSSRAAVIGQISNHMLPDNRMENIPVYLKAGRLVVAETRSNQFGEFQMEYEQQSRLQLFVYLEDGSKCFQVPLKKFSSDRSAGSDRGGVTPSVMKPRPEKH